MSTGALAKKMVAAMEAIDAVEKKGRNTQQNYNFVRSADVANEVRTVLAAKGICFTYDVISERYWEAPTKSGGMQFYCSLHVGCTFTDSETGESMTARSIGWGADSQDKAPYKAMTGALKYALRMNFLIPDESDPENDTAQKAEQRQSGPKYISKAQADKLRIASIDAADKSADRAGYGKRIRETLQAFGFMAFGEITEDKLQDVVDALEGI